MLFYGKGSVISKQLQIIFAYHTCINSGIFFAICLRGIAGINKKGLLN